MAEREWRRLKACVEQWPDCVNDTYNPLCCRFPKSCSCMAPVDETPEEWLEPVSEFSMSVLVSTIEHPGPGAADTDSPAPTPRPLTAEEVIELLAKAREVFEDLDQAPWNAAVVANNASDVIDGLVATVEQQAADLAARTNERDAAYAVIRRFDDGLDLYDVSPDGRTAWTPDHWHNEYDDSSTAVIPAEAEALRRAREHTDG